MVIEDFLAIFPRAFSGKKVKRLEEIGRRCIIPGAIEISKTILESFLHLLPVGANDQKFWEKQYLIETRFRHVPRLLEEKEGGHACNI